MWGETLGRKLTVAETEAIMMQMVKGSSGFSSIQQLVEEAITAKIIQP